MPRRIVSFLPASTEIVCALGLVDHLVGVTHECDYPPAAKEKPVVVRSAIPTDTMSALEIDRAVSDRLRAGESLYVVDETLLRALAPDLILTQNLCEVCAPSGNEVAQVLHALPTRPEIVWLTPSTLVDIENNIRAIAEATGTQATAEALVVTGRARLDRVSAAVARVARRPRVFCMEWVDPIYCSGHWVPEMVERAGGIDPMGRRNADSVRVPWDDVRALAPEVIVIMPCGFALGGALGQAAQLTDRPGWSELPAVRSGHVYVVDANAYFARPGPRVITGIELLAHLFHPDVISWEGPAGAFRPVTEVGVP
jgi:iron complex transport system substrate-binding protein